MMALVFPVIEGCLDSGFLEFNPLSNTDDESCLIPVVEGCFDPEAFNYNELANTDDNSCIYDLLISKLYQFRFIFLPI